jgi:hypothetical protein
MPNRIITDTETDATDTIVRSGLLLEIDYPGSLTSTAILSMNGSTFRMTTGSSLSTSGTPNAIPAAGLIGLGLNGTVTIDGAVVTTTGLTGIGNSHLAGQSGTGVGTVTVSGGSHVTDTWAGLGDWDDAGPDQGTLTITGANTTWYDGGDQAVNGNFGGMTVGLSGNGTLLVEAGATLTERSYGDISSYATSIRPRPSTARVLNGPSEPICASAMPALVH